MHKEAQVLEQYHYGNTGGLVILTADQHDIHQGRMFRATIVTGEIAAGDEINISLKTPDSGHVHLRPVSISSTENILELSLIESDGVPGGGNAVPVYNMNRHITDLGKLEIKFNVTHLGGVYLEQIISGTNGGQTTRNGGESNNRYNEYILKENNYYILKVKNIGTIAGTTGYINMQWVEYEI